MLSRKRANNLINKVLPNLLKILDIDKKIQIFILKKKEGAALPEFGGDAWHVYGMFYQNRKKKLIAIFYEDHRSEKDLWLTLVHELLHYKFYYYKANKYSARAEENFVRDIERLLKYCIRGKKL